MGIGGLGNTVSFGIKAVADLRGVDQTAKALAGLGGKGAQAGDGISRGMQTAERSLEEIKAKAESLNRTLDKVSKVGFAVGAAVFAGLGLAVKGASDLAESTDKASRTFGDNFEDINRFAAGAAESMGLSKRAALDAVSSFGLLFNSIGVGSSDVLQMSKDVTALAADLGSLFNVSGEDAQQALISGLVGESEPLRKFNILINETAVNAELLRIGQKQVNGQWSEGQKVLGRYNLIMAQGAAANGNFQDTSDGVANSTKTAAAQLQNARDQLGTGFLPIVAAAAQALGNLAKAFGELSPTTQKFVGFGIAGAGALALLAAAAAKTIVTVLTIKRGFDSLSVSLDKTNRSGRQLATGLGISAAAIGITIALTQMVRESEKARQGFKNLGTAISDLNTIIENLQIAGTIDDQFASFDAQSIEQDFKRIQQAIQDTKDKIRDEQGFELFGKEVIGPKAFLDAIPFVEGDIESLGKQSEETAAQLARVTELLTDPNIDSTLLAEGVRAALDAFQSGRDVGDIDVFNASIKALIDNKSLLAKSSADSASANAAETKSVAELAAAEAQLVQDTIDKNKATADFNRLVKETANAQFLASAAAKGLLLPFTRDAENAEEATSKFNQSLAEMESEAINAARGIEDIAPGLEGLQEGFGNVGDSVVDIFRKMDDAGVVDFTPAVREALDAVSALAKVKAQIEQVEAAITNNQGDLAMWNARIDLVTDTFGANAEQIGEWIEQLQSGKITQDQFNAAIATLGSSGGFPKLDALLAQGEISQKEYGQAVAAGTHLLQRSTGALQDEAGEIVRNIIALDNYVKSHDDANQGVKNLTESQRGFLAAMADSKVQTYLQTLQLLFYLSTIGQIPPEKVTKFIVDSGNSDEVIAAVNRDLGLTPGEKSVVVSADPAKFISTLTEVKGVLLSTTADGATIEVRANTQSAVDAFLELNKNELAELDGKELIVYVRGDGGGYVRVSDDIKADVIPDKVVTVRAQAETALSGIPILGGVTTGISQPETAVEQPEPIVFTATDEVTPVADAITTTIQQLETDVSSSVANLAANIEGGVAQGFANAQIAAANGAIGILSALNLGSQVYNFGFNSGWSFGVGVANGIVATWNSVFNAGYSIGQAAYAGTQAGMQAHSPSRLALELGTNWTDSVAAAIRSGVKNVRSAGEEVSRALQGTIQDPTMNPALRGLLTIDTRPQTILAQSIDRERGAAAGSRTIYITNAPQFEGVTDTRELVALSANELNRALDRGMTAGLFGQ